MVTPEFHKATTAGVVLGRGQLSIVGAFFFSPARGKREEKRKKNLGTRTADREYILSGFNHYAILDVLNEEKVVNLNQKFFFLSQNRI